VLGERGAAPGSQLPQLPAGDGDVSGEFFVTKLKFSLYILYVMQ
jgi:hypothetical protein